MVFGKNSTVWGIPPRQEAKGIHDVLWKSRNCRRAAGNWLNDERGLSESDAESEIAGVCIVSHGAVGV